MLAWRRVYLSLSISYDHFSSQCTYTFCVRAFELTLAHSVTRCTPTPSFHPCCCVLIVCIPPSRSSCLRRSWFRSSTSLLVLISKRCFLDDDDELLVYPVYPFTLFYPLLPNVALFTLFTHTTSGVLLFTIHPFTPLHTITLSSVLLLP